MHCKRVVGTHFDTNILETALPCQVQKSPVFYIQMIKGLRSDSSDLIAYRMPYILPKDSATPLLSGSYSNHTVARVRPQLGTSGGVSSVI
jgi:hypothetical protein